MTMRYIAKENDEDLETLLILFLLGMVKNEEDKASSRVDVSDIKCDELA